MVSAVYTSATTGVTNDLRLEEDGFGFVTDQEPRPRVPRGKLTVIVTTRYITSSK